MSMMLRTVRRRLVAILAAPLLLGTVTAAAPAPAPAPVPEARAQVASVAYKDTFYSDATYTVVVGVGYGYCDGSYAMDWGSSTSYRIRRHYPCEYIDP